MASKSAGASVAPRISQMNFRFEIPNIRLQTTLDGDGVWSPEVKVHDISWKVKVCKGTDDGDDTLAVYLFCVEDPDLPKWSYIAHGELRLLSFSSDQEAIEFAIFPYIFDNMYPSFGTDSMIKLRDLYDASNNYVKDDTIRLEIELEVANPNDVHKSELTLESIDKCCEAGGLGTFRLTVNNIEKMLVVRSPNIVLRSTRWFFTVFKHSNQLSVRVQSIHSTEKFSCNIQMTAKLLRRSNDGIEKILNEKIDDQNCLTVEELVSWDELLKPENGFVNSGSIVIEIELKLNKPHDVALNVRKRRATNALNQAPQRKLECAICFEGLGMQQEVSVTYCGHMFCSPCIQEKVTHTKKCPCGSRATLGQLRRVYLPL